MDRSFTVGHTSERRDTVACEHCGRTFEVPLRATASVTAEGESRDDPRLAERARQAAEESLARMAPLQSCPGCGRFQEEMLQRMFRDPAHVALRRRHDDIYASVNAPWPRARRLRADGASPEQSREALAGDIEAIPLLWDAVTALQSDPWLAAMERRFAGATEAELLTHWLHERAKLSSDAIAAALVSMGGIDARSAERLVDRIVTDAARRERSLGLVAGGGAVLTLGVILASLWAFALPAIRRAREAREKTERRASVTRPAAATVTRTATARDVAGGLDAFVELLSDGTATFRLESPRPPGRSCRFGKVLLNGLPVTDGEPPGPRGDAVLSIPRAASEQPDVFSRGEEVRVDVFAEVMDQVDVESFAEVPRALRGAFMVRLPADGEAPPPRDDDIVWVAPEVADDVPGRVEAAMGPGSLAEIDRLLFGEPRPDAVPPPDASTPTEMDRDISRAELKERAHALFQALAAGPADGALAFVADEDRDWVRGRLAWLAEHRVTYDHFQVDEITVDGMAERGKVRATFTLDHDAGALSRHGAAGWSRRGGVWLFDPLP